MVLRTNLMATETEDLTGAHKQTVCWWISDGDQVGLTLEVEQFGDHWGWKTTLRFMEWRGGVARKQAGRHKRSQVEPWQGDFGAHCRYKLDVGMLHFSGKGMFYFFIYLFLYFYSFVDQSFLECAIPCEQIKTLWRHLSLSASKSR